MPDLIRVDVDTWQAWQGDTPLKLSRMAFLLLALLVRRAGTVVTREQIAEQVWQTSHSYGSSKTIDVTTAKVRKALGDDPDNPAYLVTVRGVGYRFNPAMVATFTPAVRRPAGGDEPRRFQLVRDVDVSGVSGTGVVADGVLWLDGTASLRWRGDRPSSVHWDRLDDAVHVHGHGGLTRVEWLDEAVSTNAG